MKHTKFFIILTTLIFLLTGCNDYEIIDDNSTEDSNRTISPTLQYTPHVIINLDDNDVNSDLNNSIDDPITTIPIVDDPIRDIPIPTPIADDPITIDPIKDTPIPIIDDPSDPVITIPIIIDPIFEIPIKMCLHGESTVKGNISDLDGISISDAIIMINGCTTITDVDGNYTLENIVDINSTYLEIMHNNFASTAIPINVNKYLLDSNDINYNYTNAKLHNYTEVTTLKKDEIYLGNLLELNHDELYYPNGLELKDTAIINVYNEQINEKEKIRYFVGGFEGYNSNNEKTLFESLSIFQINIFDTDRHRIYIKNPINIYFNTNDIREYISLWYYDTFTNTWREKGLAYKQEDGRYLAEIDQLGTWALNNEIEEEYGIYKNRIIYPDNSPAKNIRIYLEGYNWAYAQLSTDSNGEFEIPVKPDEPFTIYAFTYKDNYMAEYNGTLGPIGSGVIVSDMKV